MIPKCWDAAEWRRAKDALRVLCQPGKPVTVYRAALGEGNFGDCEDRGKDFLVRVNRDLCTDFAVWVLAHEWAHCLAWSTYKDRDKMHTAHFGIAWAETYRAVFHADD